MSHSSNSEEVSCLASEMRAINQSHTHLLEQNQKLMESNSEIMNQVLQISKDLQDIKLQLAKALNQPPVTPAPATPANHGLTGTPSPAVSQATSSPQLPQQSPQQPQQQKHQLASRQSRSVTSRLPSKSPGVVPPAMFSPGAPSPSATARPTPAAPAQVPSRGFISTPERGIENITPPVTAAGPSSFAGTPTRPLSSADPKVSPQLGMVKQDTTDRQRLAMMAATAPPAGSSPTAAGGSPAAAAQPKTRFSGVTPGASSATSKPSQVFGNFSFSSNTVKPAPSFGKPATNSQSPFGGFSFGMSNMSTPSTSTISAAGVLKPAVSSKTTGGSAGGSPVVFGKPDLTQDSRTTTPGYPGFYASPKALPGASPQAHQIPSSAATQSKTQFSGVTPGASSATSKPSQVFGNFSFSSNTVKPAPSFGKPATNSQSPFGGFSFGMSNTSTPSTSTISAAGVLKPAVSSKTTGGSAGGSPVVFGKPDLTQDSRFSSPGYPGFYASPKALPGASPQADQTVPSSRKPGMSLLAKDTLQPSTGGSTGGSPVVFGKPDLSQDLRSSSPGHPEFYSSPKALPRVSAQADQTVPSLRKPGQSLLAKDTLQPSTGGSPVVFGKPDLSQDSRSSSPGYPGFYASPKALSGASPQADQTIPSSRKPGQSPLAKDFASIKAVDTPKSVPFKAEVEDDDVIFISMTQPSPDQRARAEKLMLPGGFYLYEDAPPCKGCIGCIEDLDIDSLYQTGRDGKASALVVRPKEPTLSVFGATGGSSASFGSLSINAPGGSLFGGGYTGGGISFASLAVNQSEGFGQPFGKKASDKPFAFANAGAPVFGASASHDNDENDDSHGGDDEYDPHYEPIITLPDIGSISTGEEDEEEMFRQRAKLFRYDLDSKAWKEQGVGDIKILRNPKTGGARILMRRDQILKLCANHSITPDMVLKPMMASETAWVWFAVDFSEEEAKNEQLAVNFKHVEDAKRFKEAFLEAQKLLQVKEEDIKDQKEEEEKKKKEEKENRKTTESKTPSVTEANPQLTSLLMGTDKVLSGKGTSTDLKLKFAKKPGSWDCDSCYLNNSAESTVCPACNTPKPGSEPKSSTNAGATAIGGAVGGAFVIPSGFTFGDSSAAFKVPAGFSFSGKSSDSKGSTPDSVTTDGGTSSDVAFKVPSGFSFSSQSTPSTGFIFDAKKGDEKPKENEGASKESSTGVAKAAPSTSSGATTPGGTVVTDKFTFGSHGSHMPQFSLSSMDKPKSDAGLFGVSTVKPASRETKESNPFTSSLKSSDATFKVRPRFSLSSQLPAPTNDNTQNLKKDTSAVEAPSTGFAFARAATTMAARSASSGSTTLGSTVVKATFSFSTCTSQFSRSDKNKPKSDAGFSLGFSAMKPARGETKESKFFSSVHKPSHTFNVPPESRGSSFTFRMNLNTVMARSPGKSCSGTKSSAVGRSPKTSFPLRARMLSGGYVDEKVEQEGNLYFKPIFKMPKDYKVRTGEEGEEVQFSHRAKLYHFDGESKQWKERGVGDIKVLYNSEDHKYRIVMRREQVFKVCANHYITPLLELLPNAGSDRSWVWSAMDASDGTVQNERLAVRFKTPESAKEFKEAVDKAKEDLDHGQGKEDGAKKADSTGAC